MRQYSLALFSLVVSGLVLSACGGGIDATEADKSTTAAIGENGTGHITVTLNGETVELEPWPVTCGVTQSGVDMAAKGGLPDGDSNPGNNLLVLHIGGERRANPITTIRYTPDPDNSGTEYVSLKGDAAPWFDGKRFEWSGKTERGSDLSVEVSCP